MNKNVTIGIEFEKKCKDKLISLKFDNVEMTKHTDYGADLIAYVNDIKYIFQCKLVKQTQGIKSVQEILGAKSFYKAHKTVVISQSGFTRQAQELAHVNLCFLISGEDFFSLESKKEFTNVTIDRHIHYDINYDMVKEFENIREKLNKMPTWKELDKTLRYKIKKEYGNYTNFTKLLGISFSRSKPTEEQLKNEYLRLKNLLGKVPTGVDIKKLSLLPYNSFSEYPLTKLQIECGDRPNLQKNVLKDILKEEYLKVVKILGKHPSKDELDKYGKYKYSQYANKWGNLKEFLAYAKIPITETSINRNFTKEEVYIFFNLIEHILKMKENLSDIELNTSHLKNLKFKDIDLLNHNILTKISGSFENFIKSKNNDKTYYDFNIELTSLIKKYTS